MAIIESNSLFVTMWILFVAIIICNTLVLILGLPKRRETGVNKLMIHITMGSNYFTAAFLLIILSMDSGKDDFDEAKKSRFQLLCNLSGYFGITSLEISLWSMLIAALNLLLGLLFPRKFKRGKNYVLIVRTIVLGEILFLLPLCAVPFIPISQFTSAQRNTWDSLCLPIHSSNEPMRGYAAIWFLISTSVVATLIITFGLLICYLKRQKQEAANAIPMQARLIRKKSSQVKRMSCLMMSIALCWIPALSVCVVKFAGHYIATSVTQWVFGFVLPLGAAVGPLCYIINTGLSGSTMENLIDVCCTKAEKQGNSLRVRMGQMRGSNSPTHPPNKSNSTNPGASKGQHIPHNKQVSYALKQNGANRNNRSIACRSLRSGRSKSGNCGRAKNAPRGATLVQSVTLAGRDMKETFGVVEWQASNGSPRKGLLKLFMKGNFQQWKTESIILSKLNALERHPNIVDYLWHSKSSHTRLDRGHHENMHLRRRTTVERYICTSYYHHGTLRDFLINYSVKLEDHYVHAVAVQVAAGLAFLHSNSIAHNFLESTNVLVGGHPENMTLKAVIANFTESYDMTKDTPTSPITPEPNSSNKIEDISTSWVDKFSVARGTLHDRVLMGVTEDQMYSRDVRSFALIMMEMLTWLRQKDVATRRRRAQDVSDRHVRINNSPMVDENEMHVYIDDQPSPVPFVRRFDSHTLKPRSKREQVLMQEQQQHINVVCESSPEDESFDCNTFPRRKSVRDQMYGRMQKDQVQTKSDLLRIIHQKQDSMCSTDSHDSGVSSQPSSKAMSVHSSSSGGSDKTTRFINKTGNLSDVEFDATTEMWVESHAEEANDFRPCVMEHGLQRSSTNTCETELNDSIDPISELELSSRDELGTLPRSSSSLSKFYVRKRSPRPHSFSVGGTATLPNKSNRQEMDLLNARANVNATLRSQSCYHSSEMLDNNRQRSVTPISLPGRPGSAIQFLPGLVIPQRSATPPLREQQFATIRRTLSRKRTSTPTAFSHQQQQDMNITTNPKHLRNFNGPAQFPVSNIQFISEPILQEDTPMLVGQRWDDCGCPSGVEEQHLGYCQELQAVFPHHLCSDGVLVQQQVECGRAMAKWMMPLQTMEGYLPKQLVNILEVCWSEEPAPPSPAVYRMLDNCLTEVAL